MPDTMNIAVVDTEDGGKQLVIAVALDQAGALQIADLLTRDAAPSTEDVRQRINRARPAKKTTPRRKR